MPKKTKKNTNAVQDPDYIGVRDILLGMARDIDLGNNESYWEKFNLLMAIHIDFLEES